MACQRSPIPGSPRHSAQAESDKNPAVACKRGTYSHEHRPPGSEVGRRASCHLSRAGGEAPGTGDCDGVWPGVASSTCVGAASPGTIIRGDGARANASGVAVPVLSWRGVV